MKKLTLSFLAIFFLLGTGFVVLAQDETPPPPPQPAPCNLKNVPACVEAGKTAKVTVKAAEGNGTPLFGATVDIGTSEAGTTSSSGLIDISITCGAVPTSSIPTTSSPITPRSHTSAWSSRVRRPRRS